MGQVWLHLYLGVTHFSNAIDKLFMIQINIKTFLFSLTCFSLIVHLALFLSSLFNV